ncbi:MAG: hypothetical protein KGJ45_11950, partial [Elusimicrobia bacterium]|nr:hypothetical protein [Elusimicrobiota bacterium]
GGSWHVFHLYYAVRGKVYVGSEAKCMGNIGSLVRWFNKREADLGTKRRIMPGEEVYTYRLIEG